MRLYVPALLLLTLGISFFLPRDAARAARMDHSHHASAAAGHAENGMDPGMHMDMSMPMFFQATLHTVLWFKSWETHSTASYVAALLCLLAFAIFHESMSVIRTKVAAALKPRKSGVLLPVEESYTPVSARDTVWQRVIISSLYAAHIGTGYLLMLAVMTFNVGFFFAVVAGMGIGHFLFHQKGSGPLVTDICHEAVSVV